MPRPVLLLLLLQMGALAAGELPQPIPLSKYEPLIQRSPFAPATAAPTPTPPGFAEHLFVSGIARIGAQDYVSIYDQDKAESFSLGTGENKHGISLASVQWAEKVGESKVTVKRGNDFAVLLFDQAKLAAPPAPASNPNNPNSPGQNRNGRNGQNPPNQFNQNRGLMPPGGPRPNIPLPNQGRGSVIQPPRTNPRIIPRPTGNNAAAPAATPPTRRRVRMIPSPK